MNNIYYGLKEDGIRALIDQIDKYSGRAEAYKVFAESAEGKLLVEDMRQRLSFTRSQYKYIEPTCLEAPYLLAAMQSTEREIQTWLSNLTKRKELINELSDERIALMQMLKRKKDTGRHDTQMVPTPMKKDMSKPQGENSE